MSVGSGNSTSGAQAERALPTPVLASGHHSLPCRAVAKLRDMRCVCNALFWHCAVSAVHLAGSALCLHVALASCTPALATQHQCLRVHNTSSTILLHAAVHPIKWT